MITLYGIENIQNKAQKAWEKGNGGIFDLGKKSLGSDTDTKTWS